MADEADLEHAIEVAHLIKPEDPCPGAGKCHGCQYWCDTCGDVWTVCDFYECNLHRCAVCHKLLTQEEREITAAIDNDWFRWCPACYVYIEMRQAIHAGRDEIKAAEEMQKIIDQVRSSL